MDFQDRVLEKLDKIQDDVSDIKVENAKQTADINRNTDDLKKHIRRSDLLEVLVEKHKEDTVVHKVPLTVKNLFMKIVYLSTGIGAIAGATYGILRLLDMLK